MMLQLANSIASYGPSHERRLDVTHLSGHAVRLFSQIRDLVGPPFAAGQDEPEPPGTLFMFGGYSWRYHGFYAWKLTFRDGEFATDRVVRGRSGESRVWFGFAGDTDAVEYATESVKERLRSAGNYFTHGLDMEPFEVVRDVLREGRFDSVGGAPQLAKVYRHMNTQFFAIEWETASPSPDDRYWATSEPSYRRSTQITRRYTRVRLRGYRNLLRAKLSRPRMSRTKLPMTTATAVLPPETGREPTLARRRGFRELLKASAGSNPPDSPSNKAGSRSSIERGNELSLVARSSSGPSRGARHTIGPILRRVPLNLLLSWPRSFRAREVGGLRD